MSRGRADAGGEAHLPFLGHVDETTIALKDGMLMQVLAIEGLAFETADTDELNYRKDLRDAMFRAIGASRFSLYHHILRERVEPALGDAFPDDFSRSLNAKWSARLARKRLYRNRLYLTLVRRPPPGATGLGQKLAQSIFGRSADAELDLRRDLKDLSEARDALAAGLSAYGPRVLELRVQGQQLHSEPLEFLSHIYNGEPQARQADEGPLSALIPARRISFGRNAVELEPYRNPEPRFVGMVSIKDYPGHSRPGMLDEILRLPFEFVLTQSLSFVERGPALSRMNLSLRRMRAAEDEAVSLREELSEARDETAAGRLVFGEHHLTLAIAGEHPEAVAQNVAECQAALADLGMVGVREDVGLEAAFWAQFPGNQRYIARRALISARNFSSFASFHNFPLGEARGGPWGGAVTAFETTSAGPYFFNFHQGDLGNFTIIGPSGSGKTVVLNFLLSQAMRFSPRLAFFDKDRGSEIFVRAIGGQYDLLRPGVPSGLNPLELPDTAENRRFLMAWLKQLVSPDAPLAPAEARVLEAAIASNFCAPPQLRRLGAFADLLRGPARPAPDDLHARLRPWIAGAEHGWLFDNETDKLDLSARIIGFDMTRLLDDPITRTPAMMYLFHRVEERLDGQPTLIVVDEGWKALDDDAFVAKIRDWEKTIRKRNGLVGFVTQSAEDALKSRISSAIIEQAATHIFLPNPRARREDYVGGFGLSDHEFELVCALPDHSRCFLVKHGRESVIARLDLSGEDELIAVLSGREESVRKLDALRSQYGDAPEAWLPRLVERVS